TNDQRLMRPAEKLHKPTRFPLQSKSIKVSITGARPHDLASQIPEIRRRFWRAQRLDRGLWFRCRAGAAAARDAISPLAARLARRAWTEDCGHRRPSRLRSLDDARTYRDDRRSHQRARCRHRRAAWRLRGGPSSFEAAN